MIVRLLPNQVPRMWDSIKYAYLKSSAVSDEDRHLYLSRLLNDLLSEKAQCFVKISDTRELLSILITRVMVDEVSGKKSMLLGNLYSFKSVDSDEWIDGLRFVERFAKSVGCEIIVANSSNSRVFEIVTMLGMSERYRSFVKFLNGGE